MKNLQILLLLFAFIFCFVCCTAVEAPFDASTRWEGCVENPFLASKTVNIAYLSENYVNQFQWKLPAILVPRGKISQTNVGYFALPKNEPFAPHLLSVCLCRERYDPLFFMIPYVNSTSDDVVAVCVIGDEGFTSAGIYDDEELYDLLMVKYQEFISSSLIEPTPFSKNITHSGCYDLDHYPTKDVMGQKTCLFSAYAVNNSMNDSFVYSGPLMSSPLLNQFEYGIQELCYTTVENSTNIGNDRCFYNHTLTTATFGCCCTENPESCSIPQKLEKHYYCFAGDYYSDFEPNPPHNLNVEEYFDDFYKPACTMTITARFSINDKTKEKIVLYRVKYGATDSCKDIDSDLLTIARNQTFCPLNQTTTEIAQFSMTKCCSGKNLCNFILVPSEWSTMNWKESKKCGTLEAPALYARLNLTCGAYYDLSQIKEENNYLDQKKNLYNGFNAKFVKEQSRNGINYLVAKIMKADNESCNDIVIQNKDVNKYFPFFNCGEEECQNPSILSFECEQSNTQNNKNSNSSWFCYVKIIPKQKDEFDVEAGFLEIKDYSPCYTNDIFSDTYCCVNIFDQNQVDTGCTMESLTSKYQKHLQSQKNASHELPDSEKKFTECLQRDIGPEQKCPGNDGCFEIRSLIESDESQFVEPAGCLGLAEDYTLDNLDMTNLALGCRADLNSNRCSMVQSPSGEERIVCCCNHPDENDECKTEADELPQKVGKPISSFKTLKS